MRSFFTVSIARNVGIVVAVFGMLIAGTWAAVKSATDHLLYLNATSTASSWARYLAKMSPIWNRLPPANSPQQPA